MLHSYLLACNQLFFVQPYLHTTECDQHENNRLNQLTIKRWLWFHNGLKIRRWSKKRFGAAHPKMEFLSQAPFSASPTSLLVYIGCNYETAGIQSHQGFFPSFLTRILYPQLPTGLPSQYEQFWSHPCREDSCQVGLKMREYLYMSLPIQMREQGQVLLPRVFPPEDKIRSRQPDLSAGQDARWQPTFYW